MKSRDLVRSYLFTAGWPHTWTDYVNKHYMLLWCKQSGGSSDSCDNEEEVPTGRESFPQPFAFEPTLASINYTMTPTNLLGLMIGSRESYWKWTIEHT